MENTAAQEQGGELEIPETCAADRQYTREGIGVSYKIVATPESEIKKNNRLALLVDIHQRRQSKGKQQETEDVMAVKPRKATCDSCKRDKLNMTTCSGDLVCNSCASLYGAINNRLPILASAVVRLGKADELVGLLAANLGQPWLMKAVQAHLPEQVAVQVENETLDQVAKLVGYTGESGEGLLAVIAELAAIRTELDHCQVLADSRLVLLQELALLIEVPEGEIITPKHIEDYSQGVFRAGQFRIEELELLRSRIAEAVGCAEGDHVGLVEAVANLTKPPQTVPWWPQYQPRDLTRALGLPEDALWSVVEFAAIQAAAFLEYFQVESVVQAVERSGQLQDQMVDVAGASFERGVEMQKEIETLRGNLCEVEGKARRQDVIIALIRQAINQPACPLEELAVYCKALHDSAGFVPTQLPELDAIRQALGVTDPRYNLVAAISEMAATLDQFKKRGDRYGAEKNILADQLADLERIAANLEQTNTVNEQIFARLRELLNADGLANGELPSALDSLLREGLVSGVRYPERFSDKLVASEAGGPLLINGELGEVCWRSGDPVKDALVDFSLLVLSGKVTLVHREVA